MKIDSHQHFWIYNAKRDAWITDKMHSIQRDFMPENLVPILKLNNIDGTIAVQADQSEEETKFLVDLSKKHNFIKGVVGWVDLKSEHIEDHLKHYSQFSIIKGFRHVVEAEEDSDFLIRPEFQRGVKALKKFDYTYDLLIRPRHWASTLHCGKIQNIAIYHFLPNQNFNRPVICVKENPQQIFILDHIAKPNIKLQDFDGWANFITQLAAYQNVYCKISGLVTEADWLDWKLDHFKKYIQHAIKEFGKDRIMFGTDWPVCTLAAEYDQCMKIVQDNLEGFTENEMDNFWGYNACKVYKIL